MSPTNKPPLNTTLRDFADLKRALGKAAKEAAARREQERAEQARRQAQNTPVPAVAVPAPAKPVAPAPTVARICAEAGNFFTRELCRARECLKTSQANDPICVNFRKLEEAKRAREPYN